MSVCIHLPAGLNPAQKEIWIGLTTSAQMALLGWHMRRGANWMDITEAAALWSCCAGFGSRTRVFRHTVKPLVDAGLLFEREQPWPNYSRKFIPTKLGKAMLTAIHGDAK